MAAAAAQSSRHNLHAGSSDVPLSYTSAYTSEQEYSNDFSTSATSQTGVLEESYQTSMDSTLDSFAFVNIGYSSPIAERKTHVANVSPDLEGIAEGDKENMITSIGRRSDGLISHANAARSLNFIDNVYKLNKLSAPLSVRPQINIRLMRTKSPSNECILDQDNSLQLEETTEPVSANHDINHSKRRTISISHISHKRGWYLQKVGALFKRKTSKSLNHLPLGSTDNLSDSVSTQTPITTVAKSQSYSSIHDIVESRSERLTKSQIKEKMRMIHLILREGGTKTVNESSSCEDVNFRPDRSLDREENSIRHDNKVLSSHGQAQVKVHTPERSYSLVRHDSQLNDASRVNFTRLPSLRKQKFHLGLHHQFTTTLTPQDEGEVYTIKDATHIQPLENGDAVVTDILCNNMVLFGTDGLPKITFSFEAGSEPYATSLTADGCLAVTLKRQGCVALWSTAGVPITEFGHTVLSGPTGIQCDHQGRFIVADEQANSVFVFSKEGELVTQLTPSTQELETQVTTSPLPQTLRPPFKHSQQSGFKQPRYLCITHFGNYVVADSANHCIKIFDKNMHFISQFGSYGRGDGCFKFPYGVSSDANGNLYVADHFNNRVSIFSAQGEFIQHLLTLQDGIARPKSIAVHRSCLYVTHGGIRSNKVSVFMLTG